MVPLQDAADGRGGRAEGFVEGEVEVLDGREKEEMLGRQLEGRSESSSPRALKKMKGAQNELGRSIRIRSDTVQDRYTASLPRPGRSKTRTRDMWLATNNNYGIESGLLGYLLRWRQRILELNVGSEKQGASRVAAFPASSTCPLRRRQGQQPTRPQTKRSRNGVPHAISVGCCSSTPPVIGGLMPPCPKR